MASEGSASNWSISDLKLVSYFIKIYWLDIFHTSLLENKISPTLLVPE